MRVKASEERERSLASMNTTKADGESQKAKKVVTVLADNSTEVATEVSLKDSKITEDKDIESSSKKFLRRQDAEEAPQLLSASQNTSAESRRTVPNH